MPPKILVFAGSIRAGSFNARLAALAAKELALAGADVTRISLEDYPLPLYDGDSEAQSGAPDHARKLKQMMAGHAGVFIASPEYNASLTPLLKRMEAAGLLRRTRNPENERQVIIALTPEGDALRFRAGCLNANLLEASGQTVGELGKLNQLIRQLRDAIYAHTGALGVGKPRSTS